MCLMIYVQGNIDQLPAHAQPSDSYFNNNEPTNRMIEEDDQPMICMICEDKVDIHYHNRLSQSRRRPLLGTCGYLTLTKPTLMTFASASQFHVYLPWGQCLFSIVVS